MKKYKCLTVFDLDFFPIVNYAVKYTNSKLNYNAFSISNRNTEDTHTVWYICNDDELQLFYSCIKRLFTPEQFESFLKKHE